MNFFTNILNRVHDVTSRVDIGAREKLRVLLAGLRLKFDRGSTLHFLSYRIHANDRRNAALIVGEIFVRGDYAFSTNNPRPVVIDLGANIGIATLFIKHYFPNAVVTAYEAMPENFAHLTRNVEDNALTDVTTVNAICRQQLRHTYGILPCEKSRWIDRHRRRKRVEGGGEI